jgi:hypothetical protein
MNPNLAVFFRRLLIFGVIAGVVVGAVYVIDQYTTFDLEKAGTSIMYGFFGFVMALMMALIIGVTFKIVWVNIMRRSDNILLCCPDKQHDGIHIIGKHYFSGGDSGDGYDAYHHYYIRLSDGRVFQSRKIQDESNINKSLQELSAKLNLDLQPDTGKALKVGSHTSGGDDEKRFSGMMKLRGGELKITGFDHWIDFGFRLTYMKNQNRVWRRVI